jgi:PII-like signaling protein
MTFHGAIVTPRERGIAGAALPILIELVDREDRLRAVLPGIDALAGEGLNTLEHVDFIAYRSSQEEPA